ncbi:MAG TPA: macrolide family glycosyltransferase [Solirubrobacteraceae bacterium]|nr:macrolide family glycosyltransferase [Solirubrobacteraceae bacterium]
MAHITVVGASAPSHILPTVGLVRELAHRGHRVTYAVGAHLTSLVSGAGAEPVPCTSLLPRDGEAWPEEPIAAMRLFLDEGIHVLPQLTAALDATPPDLVLHDIGGLAGPVAAARWGVRAVQLSPAAVAWEGYEEDMAEPIAAMKASPGAAAFYARFGGWLAEHGVDRVPDDVLGRPEHGIVLIPRLLQPQADRVADRFAFVGPVLDGARLDTETWTPPRDAGRIAYVALGTAFTAQPAFFRACAEALAGDGRHVVLAIGERVDPAALGDLGPAVEVHRAAPQLGVLAHADVFLTHAGMGSASEALWFGVPTICFPQAVDQFANAEQLVALGLGRAITAPEDPAAIRADAEAVAGDAAMAARLAAARAEVRAAGGAAVAADAVEGHLP